MNERDIIKLHRSKGAAPKFNYKPEVNGGVLSIPRNILKDLPSKEFVYELSGRVVNVYHNKTKLQSIISPVNYTPRLVMIMDIIARCGNQGYKFVLTEVFNAKNKLEKKDVVSSLLNLLRAGDENEFENMLVEAIQFMIKNSVPPEVPEEIEEGYEFLIGHYLEVRK